MAKQKFYAVRVGKVPGFIRHGVKQKNRLKDFQEQSTSLFLQKKKQ